MNLDNADTPSEYKRSSFHSVFREQQQRLRRMEGELSALREQSRQVRAENSQLQQALSAHHDLTTGPASKRGYCSAPFPAQLDVPGLSSYEKHIQTLERDRRCLQVELDSAVRRGSELSETVDLLESQVDKMHRGYRTKLLELCKRPEPCGGEDVGVGERVAREVRGSYAQQLVDLRERCRLYRSQMHRMRLAEKELKLQQVLLQHSVRACPLDRTCVRVCLSLVQRVAGIVEVEAYDGALLRACAAIQEILSRLLPQLFEEERECYSVRGRGRECPPSELVGQYDHLIQEIKSYKPAS